MLGGDGRVILVYSIGVVYRRFLRARGRASLFASRFLVFALLHAPNITYFFGRGF